MSDLYEPLTRLRGESSKALKGIAAASGVPYATLRKLRELRTKNPRIATVEKLRAYYKAAA